MSDLTIIGKTNFRNEGKIFGIKDKDRLGHMYVLGKTGVGKSTLLLNMAISDIQRGNGICVIDPHGDLATTVLDYIPKERISDVIYWNPSDNEYIIPFNPLASIPKGHHFLAAAGLIATFKRIWGEYWGPRLEHILRYTLLTLLDYGTATILDIVPLLTNELFRSKVLDTIKDQSLLTFWRNEFERYPPQLRGEAIAPILNKMGIFSASLPLRNTVGQKEMTWSMEEVMQEKKILIANLSKGLIGEDASSILGSMLINAIFLSALKRAPISEEARIPFYLYIDEAHSFLTKATIDILAEARKFKLSLFLSHQYLEQLHEDIRSAVFGNVGTMISFRVGAEDAEVFAKEFYPIFSEDDCIHLPRYSMYLKMMIDGVTSKPFSADAVRLPAPNISCQQEVMRASQRRYGRKNAQTKEDITLKSFTKPEHEQHTLF